jgi:hypothetical protein
MYIIINSSPIKTIKFRRNKLLLPRSKDRALRIRKGCQRSTGANPLGHGMEMSVFWMGIRQP